MFHSRKGPEPILDCKEQFFLVLVRLRTGMPLQEVARNFGVTVSHCSKLFSKWVLYLLKALRQMTRFSSLKQVQRHLPDHFREFSDTQIVIDGTEIKIQMPAPWKPRDSLTHLTNMPTPLSFQSVQHQMVTSHLYQRHGGISFQPTNGGRNWPAEPFGAW